MVTNIIFMQMSMKKKLIVFSLLFLFSSCSSLFMQKFLFNVRNPKSYSTKLITDFYEKHNIDTIDNNIYAFTPTQYEERLKMNKKSNPFVQWSLYDKHGDRIKADSTSVVCYGNLILFLSSLNDSTVYLKDSALNIRSISYLNKGLTTYNNDSIIKMIDTKNYDFTLILYWSKFMGKHSIDNLNLERHFLKNDSELRLQVIKINMDFSEHIVQSNYKGNLPKFKKRGKNIGLAF